MTPQEHSRRIALYRAGLNAMWKAQPNKVTQDRLNGFMKVQRLARISWINWVERQAESGSPAWCCELVGMVVAAKLGIR